MKSQQDFSVVPCCLHITDKTHPLVSFLLKLSKKRLLRFFVLFFLYTKPALQNKSN